MTPAHVSCVLQLAMLQGMGFDEASISAALAAALAFNQAGQPDDGMHESDDLESMLPLVQPWSVQF